MSETGTSVVNLSVTMAKNQDRVKALEARSGVKLHECYQCGKCTAGCPMAESMDTMPRQIIRFLQLGMLDEALASKSPWVCATCHTCTARCPHEVKICDIMEAVRQEADRAGIHPVRRARLFTKDFLTPLRLFGRSHELSMTILYNVTSGRLTQNFTYLPAMLKGSKLKIIPERIKERGAVKKIMENCERETRS